MTYRRAAIVSFAIAAAAMLAMASKPHPRLTGPDGPEALAMMGLSPVEEAVMDKTPHFAAGLPV